MCFCRSPSGIIPSWRASHGIQGKPAPIDSRQRHARRREAAAIFLIVSHHFFKERRPPFAAEEQFPFSEFPCVCTFQGFHLFYLGMNLSTILLESCQTNSGNAAICCPDEISHFPFPQSPSGGIWRASYRCKPCLGLSLLQYLTIPYSLGSAAHRGILLL